MAELILIRHAEAVERTTTDEARKLTSKGVNQAKVVGLFLKKELPEVELFIHSGIVRAEQTLLHLQNRDQFLNVMQTPTLKHYENPIDFAKWLRVHAENMQKVIAVGHEPQLSAFIAWAIDHRGQALIKIKKASITRLQIDDFSKILKDRMRLVELLPVKRIKKMV